MRVVVACIALTLGVALAQDLFVAAEGGSPDDVLAAIEAGADVHAVDEAGNTPLLLAVWHNGADVVEALLDAGADPHFANPKTGMGIFGLVWRNPDSAAIRAVFSERGLVAHVGVRPGEEETVPPEQAAPGEGAPPAPQETPPVDAPAIPAQADAAPPDRLSPDEAAALGYRLRDGANPARADIRDWVTSRYAVSGPLAADSYIGACNAALLDVMRRPETVLIGDVGAVELNDDGVMSLATYALSQSEEGATRRWGLRCTGFVEAGVLHLWLEVEAR